MQRRWRIVWVLFTSTAINYINRQTLSVLAPKISKQFHLSHADLSHIFGSFQISYAVMWLVGGVHIFGRTRFFVACVVARAAPL